MQNKIEARPDFKSDIIDNPFNLLKAIKKHTGMGNDMVQPSSNNKYF